MVILGKGYGVWRPIWHMYIAKHPTIIINPSYGMYDLGCRKKNWAGANATVGALILVLRIGGWGAVADPGFDAGKEYYQNCLKISIKPPLK